jgi:hypothetical protein
VPPAPNRFNPRGWNWGRWWWLIALFGVLGLFVAALFWGWFAQDWFLSGGEKWLVVGIILSVIHWVGWPVVGIFTGGYISRRLEERELRARNTRRNRREVPAARIEG